jgi:hypothetical protein
MARLKLKQVLSNLYYDAVNEQLILSSSKIPSAYNSTFDTSNDTIDTFSGGLAGPGISFIISGSVEIVTTPYQTGSLTIQDIDSFGDMNTPNTIDLGTY